MAAVVTGEPTSRSSSWLPKVESPLAVTFPHVSVTCL